jgi:hypothetical protein
MERNMPTAYVASAGSLAHKASDYHPSPDLTAAIVFSFIGLAVSAVLITSMDSNALSVFLGAF